MKKRILMIATGGTIACKAGEDGLSPALTSEEILSYVPKIRTLCDVDAVQPFNIDSTDVTPDHIIKIAATIKENYLKYDGFVVLHGTDTMAYTAAVTSYLIQNNLKPVVLTGSQKPLSYETTDARTNLEDSITYCLSEQACGVRIVFGGKVIEGTRAKKTHSKSFNAFSSINYPYLATIIDGKVLDYARNAVEGEVKFYDKLNPDVGLFKLIPAAKPKLLDYAYMLNDCVIIESFGTGGIPSAGGEFDAVLSKWAAEGKITVICTQAENGGSDMTVYKVGKGVKNRYGFLESYDMTLEAVVAKLMWITAFEKRKEEVKKLFYKTINNDILYFDEQ